MDYKNSELKIDQLVGYLNDDKINLSPAFQRGHVWSQKQRAGLLKNILLRRPIPAIFLYKEPSGSKYSYNILDGKQRLESIILFIGSQRKDLRIEEPRKYFYSTAQRAHLGFSFKFEGKQINFATLPEAMARDIREYAIPTIEISLGDDSNLDDVISLFVDINQQGEAVKRFDIVKAICRTDPLLQQMFSLVSEEQKRGQDIFYKIRNTDVCRVLKKLQVVSGAKPENAKVDRMWERLIELALYARTRNHRKPAEVLKLFLRQSKQSKKLNTKEMKSLQQAFSVMKEAAGASQSRWSSEATHFYTVATCLLDGSLDPNQRGIASKISFFGKLLDGKASPKTSSQRSLFVKYVEVSKSKTTDASRRADRAKLLVEIIEAT